MLKSGEVYICPIKETDLKEVVKLYNYEEGSYFAMDHLKKRKLLTEEEAYQLFLEGMFAREYMIEVKEECKGLVRLFLMSKIVHLDIWGKEEEYLLAAGDILLNSHFPLP